MTVATDSPNAMWLNRQSESDSKTNKIMITGSLYAAVVLGCTYLAKEIENKRKNRKFWWHWGWDLCFGPNFFVSTIKVWIDSIRFYSSPHSNRVSASCKPEQSRSQGHPSLWACPCEWRGRGNVTCLRPHSICCPSTWFVSCCRLRPIPFFIRQRTDTLFGTVSAW